MSDEIGDLQLRMEEAAAMDFEEAKRLRDRIALIRGGASRQEAESADTSGLTRQQPGRMGLGTSQQRVTPPKGWTPPPRPDPMTSGRSRRRGPRQVRDEPDKR
ncbi:MAG TPA: UvrB/UvrC motif-containing protein [Allosphingosinicella sp.]|jgi:hypothetical protein